MRQKKATLSSLRTNAASLSLSLSPKLFCSPSFATYDGPLELDVGNMAAFDPSPSGKQAASLVGDGGKSLLPLATAAAQAAGTVPPTAAAKAASKAISKATPSPSKAGC